MGKYFYADIKSDFQLCSCSNFCALPSAQMRTNAPGTKPAGLHLAITLWAAISACARQVSTLRLLPADARMLMNVP